MDESCALLCAKVGLTEKEINLMSFPFFKKVLTSLGKCLRYEAVVNLFGNSFAKDASSAVQLANPFYKPSTFSGQMAAMFSGAAIVKKALNKTDKEAIADAFGKDDEDLSWIFNKAYNKMSTAEQLKADKLYIDGQASKTNKE